jgi:hypothetical protein
MESWWLGYSTGLRGDVLLAHAVDALRSKPAVDPYEAAKAETLLVGYHARWENEGLEVVEVDGKPGIEVEFSGDLRNPQTSGVSRTFRRGGKIDALVRAPDGRVYVMEHKTSGEDIRPGSNYYMRLTLDPQCSMYLDGARDLGFTPAGVIYDVVGKPRQKPLRATPIESRKYLKSDPTKLYANQREHDETPGEYGARIAEDIAAHPEQYFQRAYPVRSEEERKEAAFDLWQTAQQLRDSIANDIWPRNPKSCEQYGRLCDYFRVCTGQARIDDDWHYKVKEVT